MPTDPPVLLSRQLGQPVHTADGVRVGRAVDVTMLYDVAHPSVHRLCIGRGRRIRYLLPWRSAHIENDHEVTLAIDRVGLAAYASPVDPSLEDHELLLARDVLDTQVVDLAGHRLSRVSDVLLVAGSDGLLEVAAVDIGAGSLLRRMGFRRLGDRFAPVAVDWADLHLTSRRGHVMQLATATTGIHRLDPSAVAELLARLSTDKAVDIVRAMPAAHSVAALHASHPEVRQRLLRVLTTHPNLAAPRRHLRTSGWRVRRPLKPPPRLDHGDAR